MQASTRTAVPPQPKRRRSGLSSDPNCLPAKTRSWAPLGEQCGLATGFPVLDAALPGGGWPPGSIVELFLREWGTAELSLFLPLMRRLSGQGLELAWIAPPYTAYAPALMQAGIAPARVVIVEATACKQLLWSMERVLRATACGLAIAWPRQSPGRAVRRLQLAARNGQTLGVLCYHGDAPANPSFAALRLRLETSETGFSLEVLKARGGCRRRRVSVDWP